jgi:predicted TIM-barrel fold metal-dependent hydrolase
VTTDCHTHISGPTHLSQDFRDQGDRAWGNLRLDRPLEEHWKAMVGVDRAIVLGFRAAASGWVIPNEFVADYVRLHPEKLVGFAGVDLADPTAVDEVDRAVELGLRGLKLGPVYQAVHPLEARAAPVYERAERLGLPIMWHQGTTFVRQAPLACARPADIDEVAIRHPDLRIVIAHMGHPWIDEAIVVCRKHPNVYMDVSGLAPRLWQLYGALRMAVEYRVTGKLLFGTDFPFLTVDESITGLQAAEELARRVGLPPVPQSVIEGVVNQDGLAMIGL